MRYSYSSELKFIIPHAKVDEGKVSSINYQDFKKDLFDNFSFLGLNYYHVVPFKEVIEGFECEAEQVVVYCSEVMEQLIIKEFLENCCRHYKELGIDTYFYIQNGVLISLEIGGEDNGILQDS